MEGVSYMDIPKFRIYVEREKRVADVVGLSLMGGYATYAWKDDPNSYHNTFIENNLMMGSGKKDKNGTEIFEGDIIKGTITSAWKKQEIVCVVKYINCKFVSVEDNKWEHSLMFAKDIKIIGNIYENPELLEVINEI